MGTTPARLLACSLAVVCGGMLLAGCDGTPAGGDPNAPGAGGQATTREIAAVHVEGFGTIKLAFFEDIAPRHVDNFKKLAKAKFYDGTTFHRIIPGFMIQGGDPLSKDENPRNDGTGGPGYAIDHEFSARKHARGVLSMARASDPNSAGSQFFIMVADSPAWEKLLDSQYTVFGEVLEGLDVIDQIAAVERDRYDRPLKNVTMTEIAIESIPVADGAETTAAAEANSGPAPPAAE